MDPLPIRKSFYMKIKEVTFELLLVELAKKGGKTEMIKKNS